MIGRVICRRMSWDCGNDGWAGGGRPMRLWKIVCSTARLCWCKLHRLMCWNRDGSGCRGDVGAGQEELPSEHKLDNQMREESVRWSDTM
jgi:hypothetical protein